MEPSASIKKDEKVKLADKIGFMKPEEISEEMEMLRKHFGTNVIKIPPDSKQFTRKLLDSKIGQLNDELVLMRNEDREEE